MRIRVPRGAPFIKIDRGGPKKEPEIDWAAIVVGTIIVIVIIALLT